MAFLNFFKLGSYTKIKEILYNKELGNIDILFQVLDVDDGIEIITPIVVKISKTIERENYIKAEKEKLFSPLNVKPEEQTQEEYEIEVAAYTVATQKILDDAPTLNAFTVHFNKTDLYENSNIESLCYIWCESLPLFEGVESDV